MHAPSLRRLLLVSLLAVGVGIAVPATAVAGAPNRRPSAVVDKKKKKKATVQIAESNLGQILVDSKGFTLYSFDPDGTSIDVSNCTGGCASAWPHLEAKKKVKAGKGLDASLLEIGAENQVAYNGHLLYRYAGDVAAGDTTGHGVGGVWHAVGADGNPIA
jgi:predicted lipoprotein with Yx(FWY)xxD motif